ncbi:MAG TPA: hypothetical protein VNU28_03175 [Solirubrobacteraceae bacterium]|jgi:hypothetical protein|nr:hypothetical protein [Solirubrobacteraceae bacterium]
MNQRVRCPHCHQWTDALLVWAAGDCCPSCNAPIAGFGAEQDRSDDERVLRGPGRISGSKPGRISPERMSERT